MSIRCLQNCPTENHSYVQIRLEFNDWKNIFSCLKEPYFICWHQSKENLVCSQTNCYLVPQSFSQFVRSVHFLFKSRCSVIYFLIVAATNGRCRVLWFGKDHSGPQCKHIRNAAGMSTGSCVEYPSVYWSSIILFLRLLSRHTHVSNTCCISSSFCLFTVLSLALVFLP